MKNLSLLRRLSGGAAALFCCFSCVDVNSEMGQNLLPTNQQYDIYTTEFYIDDMELRMADSLSAYSSTRMTLGAIRDDTYGLTTRATAITLVPLTDSLDFGENPVFRQFHFCATRDTISIPSEDERYIIQNVNVYELSEPISEDDYFCGTSLKYNPTIISKGRPIYTGGDSLSFDFTQSFGEKYMQILQSDLDTLPDYLKKFPGIYMTVDEPIGNGGRIDMFNVGIEYDSSYGYLTGTYAELKFTGTYDNERIDTSFFFYYGPTEITAADSVLYNSGTLTQYAFNTSTYSSDNLVGSANGATINVEGAAGVKPVLSAAMLREKAREAIKGYCDPDDAIITKATVVLPFVNPDNYEDLAYYPPRLCPNVKVHTDTAVYYANLTDYSISTENQGDINRMQGTYTPDITYHIQQIINDEDKATSNYDVWFLVNASTETTTTTSANSDLSDYYTQLAYSSYYNSMYGGYGSSYGSSYSNYYSYMLAAQYASSSSTTTSTEIILDKDRYFNGLLYGPGASSESNRPKIKLTFAVPKE
ncbi:MAG: hypothetical protein K5984_06565 [Bacteroidales bacterium]|nr:hypothetical protein [Bacteroidales bacterium]